VTVGVLERGRLSQRGDLSLRVGDALQQSGEKKKWRSSF